MTKVEDILENMTKAAKQFGVSCQKVVDAFESFGDAIRAMEEFKAKPFKVNNAAWFRQFEKRRLHLKPVRDREPPK